MLIRAQQSNTLYTFKGRRAAGNAPKSLLENSSFSYNRMTKYANGMKQMLKTIVIINRAFKKIMKIHFLFI